MIHFESDYLEGAHPRVLERLQKTNFEQSPGYGEDVYCRKAALLLRRLCDAPEAQVHFLVGGTQTNLTVIAALLRPHEGVLCASTGHIGVHETGAIEATGHKVLPLSSPEGKITADQVRRAVFAHQSDESFEHLVKPGMVYISNPTEAGTLYTKAEITALSRVCRELGLPLFLDGARMGYGLLATGNDLTLPEISALCDVFTIGGTKCGALFGEAIVFSSPSFSKDFRYLIKQRGGMLAKGRLLGLQYLALFEDGLYFSICEKADKMAEKLREALLSKGFALLYDSKTNQQFPILPDDVREKFAHDYTFSFISRIDASHCAVRFCTSWATREEDLARLLLSIKSL